LFAGWAFSGDTQGRFFLEIKAEADFNGFTMGAGAGIKILCSDRLYLKVGYEFNRTFVSDDVGINVNQHLITVGLGTQF
jgi:opacity protein-like surface antigen